MDPTAVELVKCYYRSLAPGRRQNLMEILDSRFLLEIQEGFPGARPSYAGIRSYFEEFLEAIYGSIELEFIPEEFLSAGSRVVATGRMKGRGVVSGVPFDVPFVHLWTAEGRTLSHARFFADTAVLRDAVAGHPAPAGSPPSR